MESRWAKRRQCILPQFVIVMENFWSTNTCCSQNESAFFFKALATCSATNWIFQRTPFGETFFQTVTKDNGLSCNTKKL